MRDRTDIVRETQGNKRFYTNHTKTARGVTRRRIDQIYTPHIDAIIFEQYNKQTDFLRRTTYGHDRRGKKRRCFLIPIHDDISSTSMRLHSRMLTSNIVKHVYNSYGTGSSAQLVIFIANFPLLGLSLLILKPLGHL